VNVAVCHPENGLLEANSLGKGNHLSQREGKGESEFLGQERLSNSKGKRKTSARNLSGETLRRKPRKGGEENLDRPVAGMTLEVAANVHWAYGPKDHRSPQVCGRKSGGQKGKEDRSAIVLDFHCSSRVLVQVAPKGGVDDGAKKR